MERAARRGDVIANAFALVHQDKDKYASQASKRAPPTHLMRFRVRPYFPILPYIRYAVWYGTVTRSYGQGAGHRVWTVGVDGHTIQ
eukprot:49325-Chlamydomonas_euryale.AAC.1